MRRLSPGSCRTGHAGRAERGLTLIELVVTMAIAAILMLAAAPAFVDYIQNARLRESGHVLYAQALLAQSEAIKRNTTVRLSTQAGTIQITDRSDPLAPVLLFERTLADGTTLTAATVDFVGLGRPAGLVGAAIDVASSQVPCSHEFRCPGLRIEGGGGIRLCADHTATC